MLSIFSCTGATSRKNGKGKFCTGSRSEEHTSELQSPYLKSRLRL